MKQAKTIWTMKNGTRIKVRLMDDKHLLNTVKMLERTWALNCRALALSAYSYAYSPMTPDGASDCAESEADQALEDAETFDGLFDECPQYQTMIDEIERRGLERL